MVINNPCTRDCPFRQIGCHSDCEKYIAFKAEVDRMKERRRLHKADEYTICYTKKRMKKV